MIDNLLNEALEDVDSNPYQAYKKYVNLFYSDMTGKKGNSGSRSDSHSGSGHSYIHRCQFKPE